MSKESIPQFKKRKRVFSYWYQINEIIEKNPSRILEIGIGNGFVSDYLRKIGFNVTTLDINEKLKPDIVASVLEIPCLEEEFELVACFEVLEHLPYRYFKKALSEIRRVCSKYSIISLPDINRICKFNITVPKFGEIKKIIPIPRLKKVPLEYDGKHHWEIGRNGFSVKKIINDIEKIGFTVDRTYRLFEYTFHRFFVLKK